MIKILVLSIFLFSFQSCVILLPKISGDYINGTYVGDQEIYSYSSDLSNRKFMDSTSVYFVDDSSVYSSNSMYYYIFWTNGRCFYSFGVDGITNETIYSQKDGLSGYYYISGDTVYTEILSPAEDGIFLYDNYKFSNDSLIHTERYTRISNKKHLKRVKFTKAHPKSQPYNRYHITKDSSAYIWESFW